MVLYFVFQVCICTHMYLHWQVLTYVCMYNSLIDIRATVICYYNLRHMYMCVGQNEGFPDASGVSGQSSQPLYKRSTVLGFYVQITNRCTFHA